jgi:nicotinamidase-related amidase
MERPELTPPSGIAILRAVALSMTRPLRIHVRWGPALEGQANAGDLYRRAVWELAPAATALVLVDIWDDHTVASHRERALTIVRERIAPALTAARQAGLTVIHAPSPETATLLAPGHRFRHRLAAWTLHHARRLFERPDWPPRSFRRRSGPWAACTRGPSPESESRLRGMPAEAAPRPGEPVVLSGAALHRALRRRRIVHLLYAGFAANLCLQRTRDYSIEAMVRRGYNPILLRDCTTGLETADTLGELLMTRVAIQQIEQSAASTTAAELMAALAESGESGG